MRNRRRDACAVVRRKGKTGRKYMQWHAERKNGQKVYAMARRKEKRAESVCNGTQKKETGRKHMQ